LFTLYRDRLWRMLYVRLDRRIQARLTPDDVLQETFLDVSRRIGEYLADPAVPIYVWLRFLTIQRMQMMQRVHLGADMRTVEREVVGPPASTESMAGQFVSDLTSPSQVAIRRELQEKLRAALDDMDPLDREVLALRHFEELDNNEVAGILGISKDAASKRHVRALKRLKAILSGTV
jgi:RNA polymerase sigma-70 factor (ECF subfamily)